MSHTNFWRGLARVGIGLAGLGTFVVFANAAQQDRTATAATAAGLCIALAILAALDLESFEGLGIKAKLRTTLSDAEARLSSLDTIIRSLSRSAFIQAARGSLTDLERRSVVDELTSALRDVGLNSKIIELLKKPIYEQIANRLWLLLLRLQLNYLNDHITYDPPKTKEQNEAISSARADLYLKLQHGTAYEGRIEDFRSSLDKLATSIPLNKTEHITIMKQVSVEIYELFERCYNSGNLTDAAIDALNNEGEQSGPFSQKLLARFL